MSLNLEFIKVKFYKIKLKFSDSCDYVEPVKRDLHGRDAFQCLLDYKQDREYCESLLECCPDHIR